MTSTLSFKVVVIGDGAVGKTCLLISYAKGEFLASEYVPTIFDNYVVELEANAGGSKNKIELGLWDTAGQEEYDRIRPLSYPDASVFLLCFSVVNKTSYQNVMDKWYPELQHYGASVPILLVGTKSDLREKSTDCVTEKEAQDLVHKIKAIGYQECSAKTKTGVKEVMDAAILAAMSRKSRSRRRRRCTIL